MPSTHCVSTRQKSRANSLARRVALVTGASSGIGRAIAVSLARQGVELGIIGRNRAALAETAAAARRFSQVTEFQIDLTASGATRPLLRFLESGGRLDILIHSAGIIQRAPLEHGRIEDFDAQYTTNVRVPYQLTQDLLPFLTNAKGQVVFINSSAGLSAKGAEIGQYAATKHALRAIADSLRDEVNPKGIRVLSVYLDEPQRRCRQPCSVRKKGPITRRPFCSQRTWLLWLFRP